MNLKANAIIGQSGGPTASINATLYGIIKGLENQNNVENIYGMVYGIEGLLNENIINIKDNLKTEEELKLLTQTPSSYLKCCRYKLPTIEEDENTFKKIFSVFEKYNIRYFFYIGGNDSMDTVNKLNIYAEKINYKISVVGVPKTVDNDLALTDHTPGFGSAAKFIATSIKELNRDINSFDLPYVLIVEIMGRNAGWLAGSAILAKGNDTEGADFIYLPEIVFSKEKFLEDIKEKLKTKQIILVAISEGVKDKNGNFIYEDKDANRKDKFGHAVLGGTGQILSDLIKNELKIKTRSVELNLLQRTASHILSKTDVDEAIAIGKKSAELGISGETGIMTAFKRISNNPYEIEIISEKVKNIANKEQTVPLEWISPDGNYVKQELFDYLLPLIQGECNIIYKDGLPIHVKL